MKTEKPNNDKVAERAKMLQKYMSEHKGFCTKEELCEVIKCSERIVRDCINYMRNNKLMVVSVSSKKGYRLLTKNDMSREDAELVKEMWCEIDNRIKELESMKQVCINYTNYRNKLLKVHYAEQLEQQTKKEKVEQLSLIVEETNPTSQTADQAERKE